MGGTDRECMTLYLSQEENIEIFSGRVSVSTRSSFPSRHIGEGAVSEVKCSAFCRPVYFHSLYLPGFLSTYINQKPVRIIDILKKKICSSHTQNFTETSRFMQIRKIFEYCILFCVCFYSAVEARFRIHSLDNTATVE